MGAFAEDVLMRERQEPKHRAKQQEQLDVDVHSNLLNACHQGRLDGRFTQPQVEALDQCNLNITFPSVNKPLHARGLCIDPVSIRGKVPMGRSVVAVAICCCLN